MGRTRSRPNFYSITLVRNDVLKRVFPGGKIATEEVENSTSCGDFVGRVPRSIFAKNDPFWVILAKNRYEKRTGPVLLSQWILQFCPIFAKNPHEKNHPGLRINFLFSFKNFLFS